MFASESENKDKIITNYYTINFGLITLIQKLEEINFYMHKSVRNMLKLERKTQVY